MSTAKANTFQDPQKQRLADILEQFSWDLHRTALHHEGGFLLGHVLIDLLEENGFPAQEIDALGGLAAKAELVSLSVMHAANSRGLDLDVFSLVSGKDTEEKDTKSSSIVSLSNRDNSQDAISLKNHKFVAGCPLAHNLKLVGENIAGKRVVIVSGTPNKGNCLRNSIVYAENQGAQVVALLVVKILSDELREDLKEVENAGIPVIELESVLKLSQR